MTIDLQNLVLKLKDNSVSSKLLLRISAVSIFLNAFFHFYIHFQWKSLSDPQSVAALDQLPSVKISLMGATYSLADYFDGYGYIIAIFLVLVAALLWALSDISENFPAPSLKLLIPLVIFLIIFFFYTIIFFAPIEAIFSAVGSALCTRAIVILHGGHLSFHFGKPKEVDPSLENGRSDLIQRSSVQAVHTHPLKPNKKR